MVDRDYELDTLRNIAASLAFIAHQLGGRLRLDAVDHERFLRGQHTRMQLHYTVRPPGDPNGVVIELVDIQPNFPASNDT